MSGCIYCLCDATRLGIEVYPGVALDAFLATALPRRNSLALEGKLALSRLLLGGAHHRNTIRTPVYIIFDDCLRRRIRLFDHQTRLKPEAAVLRQLDLTHSERAPSVRFLGSQ